MNPLALFDHDQEYLDLIAELQEKDGILDDDLEARLDAMTGALVAKQDYYILAMQNFEQIEQQMTEFMAKFARKREAVRREQERFKQAMIYHLETVGGVANSDLGKVRLQKSEAIEVTDAALLPDDCKTTKIIVSPDKKTIKAKFDKGESVPGAEKKISKFVRIY